MTNERASARASGRRWKPRMSCAYSAARRCAVHASCKCIDCGCDSAIFDGRPTARAITKRTVHNLFRVALDHSRRGKAECVRRCSEMFEFSEIGSDNAEPLERPRARRLEEREKERKRSRFSSPNVAAASSITLIVTTSLRFLLFFWYFPRCPKIHAHTRLCDAQEQADTERRQRAGNRKTHREAKFWFSQKKGVEER